MIVRNVLALALFIAILGACASRPKSETSTIDRNGLSRAELAQRSSDTMHGVISLLRPDWLRPPIGGASFASGVTLPTVFLDGRRVGELDLLRSFSAESVERARFYATTEAQNKFGMTVSTPVIELVSRGRDP